MTILIIDNSAKDLDHLQFLLNLGGHFELQSVGSITEAFELLGVDGGNDGGEYDLIIIDIFMDGHNYVDECRRIKLVPHLHDIPLIVVTENLSMENGNVHKRGKEMQT